jgi:hypothetical protein
MTSSRRSTEYPLRSIAIVRGCLILSLLAGCDGGSAEDAGEITVDGGDAGDADGGDTPVDAGLDAGATVDAGPDAGGTTIMFTTPAASVRYARGTVRLQLVTNGPDPERVELWQDGALLVVLPLPYTYDWLSDSDAEGEHVFEARALIGGVVVATAERRFEIDRTPPTLVSAAPLPGATETPLSTPHRPHLLGAARSSVDRRRERAPRG